VRDLSFRITAPGGFASIRIALDAPLTDQPDEVGYYGKVIVYDTRTGAILCEGRQEDPGRTAGADGEVWDLVAVGPAAHTRDRNVPLIYIDRALDRWTVGGGHPKADRRVDQDATGNPVLKMSAPTGTSWAASSVAPMAYPHLRWAGQALGAYNASGLCGAISTLWQWQSVTRTPAGAGTVTRAVNFTTSTIAPSQREAGGTIPVGDDWLEMRMQMISGSTQTATDAHWCHFGDVYVMAVLKDASGNDLLAPSYNYSDGSVTATEVIRDLLGRLLPQYDGPGASIATTAYAIDQLAYPDGVDPATVLDDLMKLEPGYIWEALESNAAGKYRFNWRQWPTSVRYEADVADGGYDGPGSAGGLYNAVTVRYRDAGGQSRTVRVTQSVPELTAAGLTREPKPIDLGDNIGTAAAATQTGTEFLAQHRSPPNAGRLRISRPVLDMDTSAMVMPWELRPGYLIRVRGVLPRVDALNASSRDGVTVFRIVSVEFRAADCTASLELDSPAVSVARAIADLTNRPLFRRR